MFKHRIDGVPCKHKGCLSHQSHPCELCGRVGASISKTQEYYANKATKEESNVQ